MRIMNNLFYPTLIFDFVKKEKFIYKLFKDNLSYDPSPIYFTWNLNLY